MRCLHLGLSLGLRCTVLSLAVLTSLPSSAVAQDADERARTHFESGRLHFDEGNYEAALSEFSAAYDLSHRDQLLFNLYLVQERLGHLEEAAAHLERYLATDVVPDDERETLTRRLEHLRGRLADEDTPPPTPTPATQPEHPLLIPGIVTLGVGAAGLVVFGILGGLALGEDARLAEACGADAGRTCSDADVSGLRDLSVGADVSLTIGLVAAAAGAVLLIIDAVSSSSPSEDTALRVLPFGLASADGGGAGLWLSGRFGGAS